MACPLCRQRAARRRCPALGRDICAVCCGTKRLVEITCPPDCGYLKASQAHPPASVRRQQERDLGFLMAMHEGLSPAQSELFWAILTFVVGFRADPLMKVVDDDLSDGAAALAATYETAGRGVIYEHRPQSLVAQRFVTDLQAFLGTLAAEATRRRRGTSSATRPWCCAGSRRAPAAWEGPWTKDRRRRSTSSRGSSRTPRARRRPGRRAGGRAAEPMLISRRPGSADWPRSGARARRPLEPEARVCYN